MQKKYRLGFIGIGLMGEPMTQRLLAANYDVLVWNRTPEKLKTVLESGAIACDSLQDLAQQTDIILLCLADSPIVEQIVTEQLLTHAKTNSLIIDLSSTHPEITQKLAGLLYKERNIQWVDAPVSGGVAGASAGNLAIMAGGNTESIARVRDILSPLYSQLTHMGEIGSGQVTKICNQMIVSCNALVIAEMMALAEKSGVDTHKIAGALAGGFADSKPLQILAPEMAAAQYTPVKWRVKTLLKDLQMAGSIAQKHGTATPMSALATQLMQLHGSQGFLEQDPATLIQLYQQDSLI